MFEPSLYEEWRESEMTATDAERRLLFSPEVKSGSRAPSAVEFEEVAALRAKAASRLRAMLRHMARVAEYCRAGGGEANGSTNRESW